MNDPAQTNAIVEFIDVIDELKIEYAVGGSIASSVYGIPRFTQNADITVKLSETIDKPFCIVSLSKSNL
ncbi:MAG: hypothetical protein JW828_10030 [Sedimentisphaerales bacterium]|nr:hypothetical protein [Sedimentisphaerales bacterium]